jgi:hypothetical protein
VVQEGDEHIQQSVARMQTVIELSRTIRERRGKPLKLPLRSLVVVHKDASFLQDLDGELRHYVLEEVGGPPQSPPHMPYWPLWPCSHESLHSACVGNSFSFFNFFLLALPM